MANRNKKKLSFEESLVELNNIINILEDRTTSLEDAIESYKRGVKLIKECKTQLNKAEGTIKELVKDENGNLFESEIGSSLSALIEGEEEFE